MNNVHKKIKGPLGQLTLIADSTHLLGVLWPNDLENRIRPELGDAVPSHPVLDLAQQQLKEFFAGHRRKFDLPLKFLGTPFQKKVWQALQRIPFGQTRSYSELAQTIGLPRASRAVGAANGRNPLSVFVPCHRVIGKDGSLTGFAGGMQAKKFLLDFERR